MHCTFMQWLEKASFVQLLYITVCTKRAYHKLYLEHEKDVKFINIEISKLYFDMPKGWRSFDIRMISMILYRYAHVEKDANVGMKNTMYAQ